MNRRRLALSVCVIVAAVGGAAAYLAVRGSDPPAGPLRVPTSESAGSLFAKALGRPVAMGAILITNPTGRPAVLDRVTLIDPKDGVALQAAYAALVGRDTPQGAVVMSQQWPPEGEHLHPLGAVPVPAHGSDRARPKNVQIVLELATSRAGRATFRSVGLDYHIGTHRYHVVIPVAFRLCYPESRYEHSCPPALPSQLG